MKAILGALLILMGVNVFCRADTVVFQNGDRLTGTLVNVTNSNLAFKSDAVGDVNIPLGKVQSLSAEKPVVVVGKDHTIIRGQLALGSSGSWQVTAQGASQTVSETNVGLILPEDTYHTLAEVPAAPWQDWKGAINVGYDFQHGDQQTTTLSGVVAATRERAVGLLFMPHLRTNYGLTMLFSKAQQDGTRVSSNTISTNLREDYLFTPQNFVFGFGQFDHIDTQGLYLRQSAGGGFGRDLIHSSRTTLSMLVGLNYVHDKFIDGISDQSIQALLGDKLGIQINKRLRLDQQLNFYPDLRDRGQYRFDSSLSLAFKINNHFTANAGLIDLYLRQPSPGSHENNEAVTTGLGYTF